jgi:hypothetical protein
MMGQMAGDLRWTQAMATWDGVAPMSPATDCRVIATRRWRSLIDSGLIRVPGPGGS